MKMIVRNIPIVGSLLVRLYRLFRSNKLAFAGSQDYWEQRYRKGGNSGLGSYNKLAEFKATVINDFVQSNNISSVIEFGSGDGNQLQLAKYPEYHGFDVSEIAVKTCASMFKDDQSKKFSLVADMKNERAQLTLSLDVIYHLLEDAVFYDYMCRLFDTSDGYVIIYASNTSDQIKPISHHVKHRKFSDWVAKKRTDWRLLKNIPNMYPYFGNDKEGSFADFYIYKKI
ncbi:MAG: hypothetical protein ACOH1I_08615 [Gallionellaceae bacterium]